MFGAYNGLLIICSKLIAEVQSSRFKVQNSKFKVRGLKLDGYGFQGLPFIFIRLFFYSDVSLVWKKCSRPWNSDSGSLNSL